MIAQVATTSHVVNIIEPSSRVRPHYP